MQDGAPHAENAEVMTAAYTIPESWRSPLPTTLPADDDCVENECLRQRVIALQFLVCELLVKNERLRFQLTQVDRDLSAMKPELRKTQPFLHQA